MNDHFGKKGKLVRNIWISFFWEFLSLGFDCMVKVIFGRYLNDEKLFEFVRLNKH